MKADRLKIGTSRALSWIGLVICAWLPLSCSRDIAREASDSDANGYMCVNCGAKLYSERSDFLGPRCPKCNQEKLVEVIGIRCPKDQHLTIQVRTGGRQEAAICEVCKSPISGQILPRERDLKTWGAQRVSLKSRPG